jgi:hypothetical protein
MGFIMGKYNESNVAGVKLHGDTFPSVYKFNAKNMPPEEVHYHLLEHPVIEGLLTGLSENCHEHWMDGLCTAIPNMEKILRMKSAEGFREERKGDKYILTLDKLTKAMPVQDMHFDAECFINSGLMAREVFCNLILPANIAFSINYWDNKGNVVYQKEENKDFAGEAVMRRLIILASYIRNYNTLESTISNIPGITNYGAAILESLRREIKTGNYIAEVMDKSPALIRHNPNIPFRYSPDDQNFLLANHLNPESDKYLGKKYKRSAALLESVFES